MPQRDQNTLILSFFSRLLFWGLVKKLPPFSVEHYLVKTDLHSQFYHRRRRRRRPPENNFSNRPVANEKKNC